MAEIGTKNRNTRHLRPYGQREIGSVGNTGLHSDYVHHAVEDLAESFGADTKTVLRHSICLSSDVNAAYDPTFASVYESRNSSYVNKGCVLTKYTGARRKVRQQRCKRGDDGKGHRHHGRERCVLADR